MRKSLPKPGIYCEACRKNQDHTVSECSNVKGLQKYILQLECDLSVANSHIKRYREIETSLVAARDKERVEVAEWKRRCEFLDRIILALLDGAEAMRKLERIKP